MILVVFLDAAAVTQPRRHFSARRSRRALSTPMVLIQSLTSALEATQFYRFERTNGPNA